MSRIRGGEIKEIGLEYLGFVAFHAKSTMGGGYDKLRVETIDSIPELRDTVYQESYSSCRYFLRLVDAYLEKKDLYLAHANYQKIPATVGERSLISGDLYKANEMK